MRIVACEPFADLDDLAGLGCDVQSAVGGEVWAKVLDAASDMLAIMSGGTVTGVCSSTLTACRDCFCCCGFCALCHRDPLYLVGPVQEIIGVWTNGVAMASSEYRLEKQREIVRLNADGVGICWASGDTTITYTFGNPIDEITRLATAELAQDLAKGLQGGKCALPKAANVITMNGVTVSRRELADIVREAGTDLPRVATWLSIFNPENLRGSTIVYSPEAYGDFTYTV